MQTDHLLPKDTQKTLADFVLSLERKTDTRELTSVAIKKLLLRPADIIYAAVKHLKFSRSQGFVPPLKDMNALMHDRSLEKNEARDLILNAVINDAASKATVRCLLIYASFGGVLALANLQARLPLLDATTAVIHVFTMIGVLPIAWHRIVSAGKQSAQDIE